MRLKVLILVLVGLLTLITTVIGVNQPVLHKQTMFSDEYHRFEEVELPNTNIAISNITPQPATNPVVKQQNQSVKQVVQQAVKQAVNQPKNQSVTKPVKETVNQQQKPKQPEKTVQEHKQPVQIVQETKPQENKTHELTEQEEIIAWNNWRSNLQNQVMKDAPIRAPIGTVFKFSFTVDKYGNMSNIKVWSENPNYTNLAVKVIKPVLVGYNHKSILNFPKGTRRVITNVTGGYKISTRTKYSSPSDYSDYEKVKRYY